MRTLWHFTSLEHLPLIEAEGFLRVTDPNLWEEGHQVLPRMPLGRQQRWKGPGVVWLLDTPLTTASEHGLKGFRDKSVVRIEVEVPDARPWLEWMVQRRHDPAHITRIIVSGGGVSAAEHWWIVTRPIQRSEWRSVDIRADDAPTEGSARPVSTLDPHAGA